MKSTELETAVLKQFGEDIAIFEELKSLPQSTTTLHKHFRRHLMLLVAVKQFQHGYQAGENHREEFRNLLRRRCRSFSGSVLEEEKFKVMKTDKQLKGSKAFRKPEVCFARCLEQGVVHKRHGYKPITVDRARPSSSMPA